MSKEREEQEAPQVPGADRTHHQGLGDQWGVLVGNPAALMPQIVGTVLHAGGTRPSWQVTYKSEDYVLMAWPQEEPLRAGVIMRGPQEGEMKPASAMPLMEGLPNDFAVDQVVVWESGVEANVAVTVQEGANPMWFYDPLYFRDREDLTPGITHTFVLAALAFGLRKALLDDITITQGPHYEAYAAQWLEENPGKSRLDVPPLKISMKDRKIIMPGRNFCEYEMRNTVLKVETTRMDKVEVYILHMAFTFETRPAINVAVYVPKHVCGDYEPKEGDEVDAYVWLQGRVIDMDQGPTQ